MALTAPHPQSIVPARSKSFSSTSTAYGPTAPSGSSPVAACGRQLLDEIGGKETIGFGVNSTTMTEAKGYSAHDGTAISLARIGGLKCGIITKRISETVATRAAT